jgi:hypothetical protein
MEPLDALESSMGAELLSDEELPLLVLALAELSVPQAAVIDRTETAAAATASFWMSMRVPFGVGARWGAGLPGGCTWCSTAGGVRIAKKRLRVLG